MRSRVCCAARKLLPVREFEERFVFFATAKGVVKKTPLGAFRNIRSSGIIAMGLDPDDERMRLIAEAIMPLEGAREALAEARTVRLTTVGMVDEVLQQLAAAAGRHPGDTPLYLVLENPEGWHATLAAGPAMAVSPSPELTRELEEILGPECVSFRLKRVPSSPRQPRQAGRGADGGGGRAGSPAAGPQEGGAGDLPPF